MLCQPIFPKRVGLKILLVGVAERLTVAFHLFIGTPTQEAPLLETEFIADGYAV